MVRHSEECFLGMTKKQKEFQAQAMSYKCFNNLGASYTQEFVIVSGTLLLMAKQKNCIHLFILKYENSLHTKRGTLDFK